MVNSHFSDIKSHLLTEISKAEFEVSVAVSWITDMDIWHLLQEKQSQRVDVSIALIKDLINLNNGFDYEGFLANGGRVYWCNHHHKFCVIDRKVVITGSYNWTYAAQM